MNLAFSLEVRYNILYCLILSKVGEISDKKYDGFWS